MGKKEPDEVSIKVKRSLRDIMNKILRTTKKTALGAIKLLRSICVVIFVIFGVIAILVLCIVAALTTAAERFFALLSSLIATLLAKVGNRLLGTK